MIISHLTWPGQLAFVAIALTEELVDFDNNHKIIMFQGITMLTLVKHGIKMKKRATSMVVLIIHSPIDACTTFYLLHC